MVIAKVKIEVKWKSSGPRLGQRFRNRFAGWLVVLRIDDQTAASAFALAFGVEIGLVAQGEVNDAALARGHGTELVRRTRAENFFGGDGGRGTEFLDTKRALILAIEGDFLVLSGREMQHFERKQFEGAEKFSAAIEQKRGVGAGEVNEDLRLLPVAIFRERRIDDDAVFEAKSALGDDGLQKFVDLLGGGEFVGNGH